MNDQKEIKSNETKNKLVSATNILVLNNNYEYDELSLLDYLLERNYSISISSDQTEIISALQKTNFDLILLISKNVDATCLNLIRSIKSKIGKNLIPIFLISSYTNKMDKVVAFNSGINDFIQSDAHPSEIVKRLEIHLNYTRINNKLEEELTDTDLTLTLIAHDLKGPLSYILNMSKMLSTESDILESDEKKQIINMIFLATQRLHLLLTNLLEWKNIHKKRPFFRPIKINLNKVVLINLNLLEAFYKNKNLTIENKTPPGMEIFADEVMLNSILRNLLFNAIKFNNENGRIIIEAKKHDHDTQISITDNGVGMTHEQVTSLFKTSAPQITSGTKDESGTGIGLKLCKSFIKKHGGKIWVESALNSGSKFIFNIPDLQF